MNIKGLSIPSVFLNLGLHRFKVFILWVFYTIPLWLGLFSYMFVAIVSKRVSKISSFAHLSLVCREVTGIYKVILYSETLLKVLIISQGFPVKILGYSMYSIILLINKDNLISFPIFIPLISFFCIISLDRDSRNPVVIPCENTI